MEEPELEVLTSWPATASASSLNLADTHPHLVDYELLALQDMMNWHSGTFAESSAELGCCRNGSHTIHTTTDKPIRAHVSRLSESEKAACQQHVDDMLRDGIIEPSASPWRSKPVIVPKKDGTTRFCVNYRPVNSVTAMDANALPNIQEIIDQLGSSRYFSILDCRAGYWQIPMAEESKAKTTFWAPDGLYQFVRMPFGLCSAPATYQRAMDEALCGLPFAAACMDDIVVHSGSYGEHIIHLYAVLERMGEANIKLHPGKCQFMLPRLPVLGHHHPRGRTA